MANNRVWLVCRNCKPEDPKAPYGDERIILAKHFMNGWQTRDHFPVLDEWLKRHEEHFWDKEDGTEADPWDHQFELEYEA